MREVSPGPQGGPPIPHMGCPLRGRAGRSSGHSPVPPRPSLPGPRPLSLLTLLVPSGLCYVLRGSPTTESPRGEPNHSPLPPPKTPLVNGKLQSEGQCAPFRQWPARRPSPSPISSSFIPSDKLSGCSCADAQSCTAANLPGQRGPCLSREYDTSPWKVCVCPRGRSGFETFTVHLSRLLHPGGFGCP